MKRHRGHEVGGSDVVAGREGWRQPRLTKLEPQRKLLLWGVEDVAAAHGRSLARDGPGARTATALRNHPYLAIGTSHTRWGNRGSLGWVTLGSGLLVLAQPLRPWDKRSAEKPS